jgi:hypothetical protein
MTSRPEVHTPFSRYFLIVATIGVAFYQATRGNWFEVAGLAGLGGGLVLLIAAQRRPVLRWLAMVCFAVTAAAVVYVYRRDYQ